MEVDEAKAALRSVLRARRRAMDPDAVRAAAEAITRAVLARPDVSTARTVALYVSYGPEPGTTALRKELRYRGVRVLLPVLLPDDDLDWAEDPGDADLYYPLRGPATPRGPRFGVDAITSADVVIDPGLAVDRDGVRLGQGGGSYDRALARVSPTTPVLVLLYDGEVLEPGGVPADVHDRRVSGWVAPADAPAVQVS
jgi:5-formyltetrahydrofolate cyclo-ligase